jgi:phage I-like protein
MPRIAFNQQILGAADSAVPDRLPLIPAGPRVQGRDGRAFLFDALAQESVLAAFVSDTLQLPIDWEHASQHRAPKGETAPAAAWITQLEVVDGQLVGHVEWTPRGHTSIESREYRYLSPVFDYDPESGRILQLVSAGLTNRPNLLLPALNQEQDPMKLSAALAAALGISVDSTEDQAVAAIASLKTAANTQQQPQLDRYVPRADYDALVTRATNAEQALADRNKADHLAQVETAINAALTAGKITPATVDYHRASCADAAGLERFNIFAAAAPVVAGDTVVDPSKRPPSSTALNADEREVCRLTGIDPAAYLASKQSLAAAGGDA